MFICRYGAKNGDRRRSVAIGFDFFGDGVIGATPSPNRAGHLVLFRENETSRAKTAGAAAPLPAEGVASRGY